MRDRTFVPTSEARPAGPVIDGPLLRSMALAGGVVPLVLLGWDAWHHRLGVNPVNFAIRTTGILGLTALVLSLLITPLRQVTGWGALVAARRRIGVLAFAYLAVHFTLFFAFDRAGSVASTVHEIVVRRYLQIGTVALLLLVPLAATSTDAMVTRLGPRTWKRLHRFTYLAVALGALHYILLVKSDRRQPLAYAAVLVALLGYRVVRHYLDLRAAARRAVAAPPATRRAFWTGELRVARVFDEAPDVRTLRLVAVDGGPLPFAPRPGQYLTVALNIDGRPVKRSYTLASSPARGDHCEITVKRAANGYASHHVHAALVEGSRVKVSGPAGGFVFDGEGATQVVLLAGGVGITPLMSMVRYLTDRCWPGTIYLVFSVRRASDVIFRDELAYLAARHPQLHVTVTLTQEPADSAWRGSRGPISSELLQRVVPTLRDGPVYLCGPDAMMTAMRARLAELGVDGARVFTEAFVSPSSAAASEPADGVVDAQPAASSDGLVTIDFARSKRSVEAADGATVLEAAESAGIAIPFDCRAGICGQCKTRLRAGTVAMETQDALTADDRAKGLILACQARPAGAVTVEA